MNCFVFDIDGVIVNLYTKKPDPQILQKIAYFLSNNTPVSFVSGRSSLWVIKNVVQPIKEKLENPNSLDNLLILGEFGSAISKYKDSKIISAFDDTQALPFEFVNKASEITKKYSDTVKIDETKQVEFSCEMKEGLDIEGDFGPVKKKLTKDYKKLISQFDMTDVLEVKEDTIGINIKSRDCNKENAMKSLFSWISEKNLKIDKFYALGDSFSDLQMGQGLKKAEENFEFVFVGNEELPNPPPFPIHKTGEKFEKGTLEFLDISYIK